MLANIALHGLEETLVKAVPWRYKVGVVRYADDLVVLCDHLGVLMELKELAEAWLGKMGLGLKSSKTRITHTLDEYEGNVGFDFLGFNVRQYRVGRYRTSTYRGKSGYKTLIKPSKEATKRHLSKVRNVIRQYRGAPQDALISVLNPIIRGWARYYRTCIAKRTFSRMDYQVKYKLYRWARYRHPRKKGGWCYRRYWRRQGGRKAFSTGIGTLTYHSDMPIVRHIKVRGDKSPYDGDWLYWGRRLGRDPSKPTRVIRLLKWQRGRCFICGHHFVDGDRTEIHHWDGDRSNNRYANLVLLHTHCHDQVHGKGADDNSPRAEEPREVKVSSAVL